MTQSYHIYFRQEVLFKNLTLEEFTLIWDKLYTSYWKDDITFSVCYDEVCIEEASF